MKTKISALFLLCTGAAFAAAPFSIADGVLTPSDRNNAGLATLPTAETYTVFSPTDATDHYSNGVVMTAFKGKFYCQWQSSATDEDAADTWVAYAVSSDAKTWTAPKVLATTISNGHRTSGGWWVNGDTLVAYLNEWPDSATVTTGFAFYTTSVDGEKWSALKPVLMKDGSAMQGVIEQDLQLYENRILGAAHFAPGLHVAPIYSDDLSGVRGFVKANITMEDNGNQSRGLEPSLYINGDGNPVMVFRDQNSTYLKMGSISYDKGANWTAPELTNFADSRAKQSAGNLPDGAAFIVSNPADSNYRIPLAVALSEDGKTFTKAYTLRTKADLQSLRYEGKYKKLGYHYPKSFVYGTYLYSSYATNKEDVEFTRVPLASILFNLDFLPTEDTTTTSDTTVADTSAKDTSGIDAIRRKLPAIKASTIPRDALGRNASRNRSRIRRY